MYLESFEPSKTKKYKVVFRLDNNKTKTIHFGAKGAGDFTQHKSEKLKQAYIARHSVNEDFNNPLTAGALSRWILWNKTTIKDSLSDFKRRFNL
jgi:hypothetical protein